MAAERQPTVTTARASAATPPSDAPTSSASGWVDACLRVRYAETDAQGVVYHANYLVFMEVGRGALARARGLPYSDLEARGVNLLVAGAELKFRAPARYDDALVVRTRVSGIRGKFVSFEYKIEHADEGRVLVTGRTTHVCVDADFKPMDVPPWVGDALSGVVSPPAGAGGLTVG